MLTAKKHELLYDKSMNIVESLKNEMRSRRPLASFGDVVNRCIMLRDRYVATGYNSQPTVADAVPTGNSWICH